MNHDKDPKPSNVTDLNSFREQAHPAVEQAPVLTDILTSEFPEGTTQEQIVETLIREMANLPARKPKDIVMRMLEELHIVDFMDDLMQGPGNFNRELKRERIDREREIYAKLTASLRAYSFMQKSRPYDVNFELSTSIRKVEYCTNKKIDSFAVIQVLLDIKNAFPENANAQDAYNLALFLLEACAQPDDFGA